MQETALYNINQIERHLDSIAQSLATIARLLTGNPPDPRSDALEALQGQPEPLAPDLKE
jgi:hypothetical protein